MYNFYLTLTYNFTLNHGPGLMDSAGKETGSQAAETQSLAHESIAGLNAGNVVSCPMQSYASPLK